MTKHELNIVKLADVIEKQVDTRHHLINRGSLIRLNTLIECHAIMTGTKPEYYDQTEPELGPAKDYHAD